LIVTTQDQVARTSLISNSLLHRSWPVAGLIIAVVVNLAWMGFLGYGLFRLLETTFL
jgi:hypothetical protein